jgi:hypothetical protein
MAVRQKNQINANNSDKQNGRRETSRAAVQVAGAVGSDDLGVGGGWKLPTDWTKKLRDSVFQIWKNKYLRIDRKARTYKTCIRQVMTYGAETRAEISVSTN